VTEPRSMRPVMIGVAMTVMFLILLGYLTQKRRQDLAAVPRLSITTPAPHTVVDTPLVIRFTSSPALQLQPTGWGYDRMHLHAWLNDQQYMPGATDIHVLDERTFEWILPTAVRGSATLRLRWADAMHRALPEGATEPVTIEIR
jgi:hypothetical protein